MKNYLKLIRLKHSIKNLLVFLPIFFSRTMLNKYNFFITLIGLVIFTLTSSSIYIINDIKDIEKDKKHPTKCKRPIAAGKISIKKAIIFLIILLLIVISLIILLKLPKESILLLLAYFILNLIYSFGAKNVPLLDIVILVSGFVIRILFGASLTNINVSNWLLLTVLTLSFYMGLGKRRNEIEKYGNNSRKVLNHYNKEFLDKNMYMLLSCSIVFYALWSVSQEVVDISNNYAVWTVPYFIILAMKYSMDIEGNSDGDPVEVILNDKLLIGLGIIYVLLLVIIIYL